MTTKQLSVLALTGIFLSSCLPRYHNIPIENPNSQPQPAGPPAKPSPRPRAKVGIETVDLGNGTETTTTDINYAARDAKADKTWAAGIAKIDTKDQSKPAAELARRAKTAYDGGNYSRAEGLLERAIRINPHDPELWHKMARIKYARGDYRQASSMAMRSNTMTGNSALKSKNWRIIGDAREKMGDLSGAEQARRFADK